MPEMFPRILFLVSSLLSLALPVFPGAGGFGSDTVGGSGRHLNPPKTAVYRISTLADSGPGSLRECAEAPGPRVCVFEISGRITLSDRIRLTEPFLTIAGQTAPPPGILITGSGIEISTHDVLIQHLRIRPGDDPLGPRPSARDALTINGKAVPVYKVVLDHLSLSWAVDENFSTYGAQVKDVTLSNSIVSEGLFRSIHPDGPHSMGILIGEGSQNISVHHCLLANNSDRNPRQKGGTSLEFLNNFIYHWGGLRSGHMANPSDTDGTNAATLLSFAGNFYQPGPKSPLSAPLFASPPSSNFRVYVAHNIGPTRKSDSGNEWSIANFPEHPYRMPKPPFEASSVKVTPAEESKKHVLAHAGARPYERSTGDQRILDEIRDNRGTFKDCVAGCERSVGGWPEVKVNRRKLLLPESTIEAESPAAYTELELFLHCHAKAVETGSTTDCTPKPEAQQRAPKGHPPKD